MHFSDKVNGIPGNDDLGSMSSLLIFASLGLFPQAGTNRFLIGSPRINGGVFNLTQLDGMQTPLRLKFIVHNNSAENIYVSRLVIDGINEVTEPFLYKSSLLATRGSAEKTIEFFMTSTPKSGLCSSY